MDRDLVVLARKQFAHLAPVVKAGNVADGSVARGLAKAMPQNLPVMQGQLAIALRLDVVAPDHHPDAPFGS